MRIINKIIIFLFIPIFVFATHKYFISLTKIDYIEKKKTVQIMMRFFIDDIENCMNHKYNVNFELATKQENEKSDFYLGKYISQKFNININDKKRELTYIGKEYDNDLVYFYLEINKIKNISNIEVRNTMLFECFESQENLIKMHVNGIKKTILLVKSNDNKKMNF